MMVTKRQEQSTASAVGIGYISGSSSLPIACGPPRFPVVRGATPSAPWGCCYQDGTCANYWTNCIDHSPGRCAISTTAYTELPCGVFLLCTSAKPALPRYSNGQSQSCNLIQLPWRIPNTRTGPSLDSDTCLCGSDGLS